MPIDISEYATPKLVKMQDRWPISYDKTDRYNETCPRHFPGRYNGSEGRFGGWKQAGYNPNHQTTSIERVSIRTDNITLRPY